MNILVVGATGATGRLLVEDLLKRGETVKAIVRSPEKLKYLKEKYENLILIEASISKVNETELHEYVKGCDAIASCLGHNLSFKGMFAPPYRLVTDSMKKLCSSAKSYEHPEKIKIILMNTTGNVNKEAHEKVSLLQSLVLLLLRALLPPHIDNEQAAKFLQKYIGDHDSKLEWVAVRPDTLIDEGVVTEYELHPSPTRSAIFNSGQTSRINVANFMAELICDDNKWSRWQNQMPVIYNK